MRFITTDRRNGEKTEELSQASNVYRDKRGQEGEKSNVCLTPRKNTRCSRRNGPLSSSFCNALARLTLIGQFSRCACNEDARRRSNRPAGERRIHISARRARLNSARRVHLAIAIQRYPRTKTFARLVEGARRVCERDVILRGNYRASLDGPRKKVTAQTRLLKVLAARRSANRDTSSVTLFPRVANIKIKKWHCENAEHPRTLR